MRQQAAVVVSFLAVTLVSALASDDWDKSTSIRHVASFPPARSARECSTNCADQMTPGKQCWSCTYNPNADLVTVDYSNCGFTDACCAHGCQEESSQGRRLLFSTIKPKHGKKSHGGFSWFTYGFTGPTMYNRSPSPFGRRLNTFFTKPHWQSCPANRVDRDERCCMAGDTGECARSHICLVTIQYVDPAVCSQVDVQPSPQPSTCPPSSQPCSTTPDSPYLPISPKPHSPSPSPGPSPGPSPYSSSVPSPYSSPLQPQGTQTSPVPTSGAFPYCPCTNNIPSPFHMSAADSTRVLHASGNRYCFFVTTTAIPESTCNAVDLRKIEFDINPSCRGAATDITFDGDSLTATYQQWQNGAAMVLKVIRKDSATNPLGTFAKLVGRTVETCFTLRPDSACTTIDAFARDGIVSAAFFGERRECCFTVVHPY